LFSAVIEPEAKTYNRKLPTLNIKTLPEAQGYFSQQENYVFTLFCGKLTRLIVLSSK
jgi:hypothetical protein